LKRDNSTDPRNVETVATKTGIKKGKRELYGDAGNSRLHQKRTWRTEKQKCSSVDEIESSEGVGRREDIRGTKKIIPINRSRRGLSWGHRKPARGRVRRDRVSIPHTELKHQMKPTASQMPRGDMDLVAD